MVPRRLHAMTPGHALLLDPPLATLIFIAGAAAARTIELTLLVGRSDGRHDIRWLEEELAADLAVVARLEDVAGGDGAQTLADGRDDGGAHRLPHVRRLGAHLPRLSHAKLLEEGALGVSVDGEPAARRLGVEVDERRLAAPNDEDEGAHGEA